MPDLVWFNQVDKSDVGLVGGKGANLGELTRLGVPVPPGFIVTAEAYFEAVKTSGALDRIKGILFGLDYQNPIQLQDRAYACQNEIKKIQLSEDFKNRLFSYYHTLSGEKNALVAVRSSATAEDLPEASFAGQQSTFLNVKGENNLKDALLMAWASLFEARAIFYRNQKNYDHFKVGIAIPVQKMVQSHSSGVMFTVDPVTTNKKIIVIEAIYGLGELIVQGMETPDHYEVEKENMKIISKILAAQKKQMVLKTDGNKILKIAKSHQKDQKISDELIIKLAKIGQKIEKHYFFPQDIEWAAEGGKFYIVQSRPVTTLKGTKKPKQEEKKEDKLKKIVVGAPASPVIATGPVVVIRKVSELSKVKKGDVLVAEATNPDYVPAMKKAVAIVTQKGGRTSHAAIISRELGIASVVGAPEATQKLKDGMIVTVDGSKGVVFEGSLPGKNHIEIKNPKKAPQKAKRTATKLFVNIADPDLAAEVASKNVDGVGLLRAEFLFAKIGIHPKEFLKTQKSAEFVTTFSEGLTRFARAFGARPVLYRASDFKSNEYRNLKGGEKYELKEENPLIGYRGAFRYIKDPDVFKMELDAILKVRQKHKNLHLMIPFVRNPNELAAVRKIVEQKGLFDDNSFEFHIMAELPANVISLEDFIKVGINGISIGSNDLTMLILGVDRDNQDIAADYWEMDPSVVWALKRIIKTAAKFGKRVSICGEAPSIYPELTELLIREGISSISVNPDVVDSTRELIYEAEKKLLKAQ